MKKLIGFELRKLFSRRLTQVAFALVLLFSAFLSFSTYQNKYAFDGKSREGTGKEAVEIEKEVAERYAGPLTDQKVQRMLADLVPKTGGNMGNAVYLYHNTTQSAVSARFAGTDGSWNGLTVSDVFGEEKITIGYVDGWLSTSQNLVKILVFFSLFLIVMTAPVFCGEYGGVDQILLAARYGKTKCSGAKVTAAVLAALLTTAAVLALNFAMALAFYGAEGLDCSILFAQLTYIEGGIPFNITCGTMLAYQVLLAFTGSLGVVGITLVLSAACKNPMVALAASAVLYGLPVLLPVSEASPLFRLVGLLPTYHAQFVSLMSVEQLGVGVLYAVWAVPAAAILLLGGCVLSRGVFARHQVS